MIDENPPEFPNYPTPQGMPVADRKQAGPLHKMISKMIRPKVRAPKKGLQSNQSVKINHKKVKFY